MALVTRDLFLIADLVRTGIKPPNVLSFGHPDILATPNELSSIFNGKLLPIDNKQVRQERIGSSDEKCIGSAFGFFAELHAGFSCIDKRTLFGVNIADLNYPLDNSYDSRYSLVIDPGTIEHIMNVGEVLSSIVRILQIGGHAYHASPMSMLNHGYWNFSPVTYHDFYTSNGFEIVLLEGRRKRGGTFEVPVTARFKENTNSMIACIAKKVRDVEKVTWPVQKKYTVVQT